MWIAILFWVISFFFIFCHSYYFSFHFFYFYHWFFITLSYPLSSQPIIFTYFVIISFLLLLCLSSLFFVLIVCFPFLLSYFLLRFPLLINSFYLILVFPIYFASISFCCSSQPLHAHRYVDNCVLAILSPCQHHLHSTNQTRRDISIRLISF